MAIKISSVEYQKKFGQPPILGDTTQPNNQAQNSLLEFGKGIAKGGLSTLQGIQDLGTTVANKVLPGFAQQPESKKGINYLKNDFSASNNAQLAGKITEGIGEVFLPIGGTEKAMQLGSKAVEKSAPLIETAGKTLKGAGESAYRLTVPPSESTAEKLMSYDAKQPNLLGRIKNFVTNKPEVGKPITEANTAARKGLVGTEYQLGVQAKKAASDLWNTAIAPKLDQVKGQVNMKSFFDQVEKDIVKNTKELNRRNALKEALNALRDNYKNVGTVNLKKLQEYKEGFAKFLPDSSYKGKPIGAALKEVQNIAAKKARDVIYNYIGPEGRQAYLDYGNLQSIIESGKKSITGDLAKKSLSRDIWQVIMDKAVTPVATVGGQILYKTGEGLEFIGKKGAKTVKDVIGK